MNAPGRKIPTHKVNSLATTALACHAWEDELDFNTQASSQWDSLVHMQHQPTGLAYNGFTVTEDGLTAPQTTAANPLPTIDHWHAHGGLVERGVLVDFKGYTEEQARPYHAFEGHRIAVDFRMSRSWRRTREWSSAREIFWSSGQA